MATLLLKKEYGQGLSTFFTTKLTIQGNGLGLLLSYNIVKAHKGELKVYTDECEFADFETGLPS